MALETEVILKQIYLQLLKSETVEEARKAVEFLLTKEAVAEAKAIVAEQNDT